MFHNTTGLAGQDHVQAKKKAGKQDELILNLFKLVGKSSPSSVAKHFEDRGWPLTSVRRSINSLTEKGELTKTAEQVKGAYGRPEHVWVYSEKKSKQGLLFG